jgi:hypothetical protein
MAITLFCGDEDKDEINPKEWLRMVKNIGLIHFGECLGFGGVDSKWWNIFYEDTRLYSTWEKFEKIFSKNGSRIKKTKGDA